MHKKLNPVWFRSRGYPHFDQPVHFEKANQIVSNPIQVAEHSFYPFIKFTVKTIKVKFNRSANCVERQKPKIRDISYASHVDSHIYAYYSFELSKLYESAIENAGLCESIIAFRSLGKNNIHFAAAAFKEIKSRRNCHVLCLDIKGFFDNLDHQLLKASWAEILDKSTLPSDHFAVFKSITKFATVDRDALYKTIGRSTNNMSRNADRLCTPDEFRTKVRGTKLIKKNKSGNKGIPQGSPISALLSNIYMFNFDKKVNAYVKKIGGSYFRYCDDMFIIVPLTDNEITKKFLDLQIKEMKLEFQDLKTEQINFSYDGCQIVSNRPLQYLGFIFDGNQTLLRSASLARYSNRMKRGVKLAKLTMAKHNKLRLKRGEQAKPLFRKKLFERYTHFGRRNFLSYGYKAAKILESKGIKRQLGRLWGRVQKKIDA